MDTTSRFAINIAKTAVRYNKDRPISGAKDIRSVIIIPEGTPEDKIFTLLADQLNGDTTTTILKPTIGTGLGFIDHLSIHLKSPIEIVTIVVDRDCYSEEELLEVADRKLAEKGFRRTNQLCPNCYEYIGTFGGRSYTVLLLVNGCDEIETEQHTIEDHLLKTGNIQCESTSKQAWKQQTEEEQKRIIRQLANGGTGILRNNFPQHYATIQKIKTLI